MHIPISFITTCIWITIGFYNSAHAQSSVTTSVKVDKSSKRDAQIEKCNGNEVCGTFYKLGNPIQNRIKFNKGGLWGFVDFNGNEIVPPIYSEVSDFDESGHAKFLQFSKKKKQYQYGLLDLEGNITISPKYERLGKCRDNRIWAIKKEKVGFLNCTGAVILPLKYQATIPFSEGIAAYENRKGLFQYIDMTGDKIFKTTYQVAGKFHDGIAYVKDNENWYLIDKKGNRRVGPLPYDFVANFQDGLYAVKSGELKGLINQNGDVIIPLEYQALHVQRRIRHFTEKRKNQHSTKIEFKSNFDPRFIYAKKNNKWGLLDTSGNMILPMKFSDIESSGFVNGNIRVIDETGSILFFDQSGQQQTEHALPWKFLGYNSGSRSR